jgi:oxygen-dependent protoporphyrinogen oxidase
MRPKRVEALVVGGGISGLACLWRLVRSGVEAFLLEATDRVGGLIRTAASEGFLAEEGPNTVLGVPELEALIEEAGLSAERIEADPKLPRWIFWRGELHRAPLGPGAFLRSRLLSARGKLRILREPWIPPAPGGRDESVREFFERRFGPEVHDLLVAPLVSGTFAGDTAALSLEATFPSLARLERRYGSVVRGLVRESLRGRGGPRPRLVSFRQGLETLPLELASRLGQRIRTTVSVQELCPLGDGGFEVRVPGEILAARAVVLAVEAPKAAELLRDLAPEAAAELAAIEFPPLTSLSLAYPRRALQRDPRGFGFLVPPGEELRILGCLFASSIFPGRAPADQALFTVFLGGATDPEAGRLEPQAAIRTAQADLGRALGANGPARVVAMRSYARAIPQYGRGHRGRVERIVRSVERVPGLFVCGNFLDGVSVGDCVRRAEVTATAVLGWLRR